MKVLHIGKYFPPFHGGIETFMSQLMKNQAETEYEVIAVVHGSTSAKCRNEFHWNDCKVYEVNTWFRMLFVPLAPIFPWVLRRVIRQNNPNIIHVHLPNASAFFLLPLIRYISDKTKIVLHWHSDVIGDNPPFFLKLLYPVYRYFERKLLRLADKVIVTSENYKRSSEPLADFMNKCQVIPLGIEVQNNPSGTSFTNNIVTFLMIGRFTYYKNHRLMITCFAELAKKYKHIRLNFIGSGELLPAMKKYAIELGVADKVSWYKNVSETEKFQLIKSSDILCLPSLERTEAFGVVLLEAAACGIPTIVSDVEGSGMSNVVSDEQTGLLFKNNNVSDLVAKMERLISEQDLLGNMGEAARDKFENNYSIQRVNQQISDLYLGL